MKVSKSDHTFAVCAYKESPFLEECIKSLKKQTVQTNIIIATSTPCNYISNIAKKYELDLFVNEGEAGITQDWNFAYSKANTNFVTIAHQDDLYNEQYVENLMNSVKSCSNPLIFFTDYAEIRDGQIVTNNKLLRIKRFLLSPLKPRLAWKSRFIRRRVLSMGCAICCPSVTFYKPNLMDEVFQHGFRSDEDWEAWERLSKLKGEFIFCNKILTYHRIHEDSETTKILQDNQRTKEDLIMYKKFWPEWIAKKLAKAYSKSEESNSME